METLAKATAARAIERLEALADWDDPRLAAALLALLRDPPYRSRPALRFYKRVVELSPALGIAKLSDRKLVAGLLEEIYAAPKDDGPRAVYADYLSGR